MSRGNRELKDIPTGLAAVGSPAPRRPSTVENFSALRVPTQPLVNDRAADHVPAEAHGALPVLDSHCTARGEATVAPGQEVVHGRLVDEFLAEEHAENLRAE